MTEAYVTADGNYGGDEVLVFDPNKLTDMQWEILTDLSDRDRLGYVQAILSGNEERVKELEQELS